MRVIPLCEKCLACRKMEAETGELDALTASKYGGPLLVCQLSLSPDTCLGPFQSETEVALKAG